MHLIELKTEIPINSVEEIDARLIEFESTEWNLLENTIERRAWLIGVFTTAVEAQHGWNELISLCPALALTKPESREIIESEWRDSYKIHFKAWQFGRLHWVPIWERDGFVLPEGHEVLCLDPGLAFGTGNHETTRLCVERMVEWVYKNGPNARVLDAGCGSGILALSAAKLGFSQVSGFDNDREAVRVSEENAVQNGLACGVDFYEGDLITGLHGRQAELVLANILADVLIRFAPELIASVAPKGQLVLSGILAQENAKVRQVFSELVPNWTLGMHVMGEWSDVVLRKPD